MKTGENMRIKSILLVLSFIFVAMICIGSVVAIEDNNITDDSLNLEKMNQVNENILSSSQDDSLSSNSQIITVDNIGENHREMNDHTIRNAISNANSGDTIIINGQNYDHVHIVIDKQLTIKSNVGTTLSHCSNQGAADSGHQGIFYLTSKASGTIIEGFNFINDDGMLYDSEGYAILINGASNVIIRNCNISNNGVADGIRMENSKNTIVDNVNLSNTVNGIKIKNSIDTNIKNSIIKDSTNGVYDQDSTRTVITSNNILNNNAGIYIAGSSNNPTVSFNNLTANANAISLTSSDNINILSNYIALNTNHGVYINCKVEKINIIGNFFYKNVHEEVFNDVNTKGLYVKGGEELEVVNNNYFVGFDNRPVQREDSIGGGVFLGYAFEINTNVACPIIYSTYGVQWTVVNYRLQLSEITQSKKGVYSISIVDGNGNVAKGLSSVPVTFYLNKNNNYVDPQEGDVYKTVMMVDGTATVRFYPDEFKESGNVVTAVTPGLSDYLTGDQNKNVKTFNVEDKYIPGNVTATKISISDLNTYPNSNVDYSITLTDIYNNPVANEPITINIGSQNIQAKTNENGQASIKINQNAGNYIIKVNYEGDDIDYSASSSQAKLTVNKVAAKFDASNYAMLVKKADYYKVTLSDASGNALANQKITFKVNKKTYNVKTNAKGEAKIKLKLKKGTYKVVMNYKGNSKYLAAKKTNKIKVKKNLKTKLTAPKVVTAPNTSTKYAVTLKNENGKAISKQKVTVKVNGKKYTKKTNGNGQVVLSLKFSKLKSYNVKATYKGTKVYKKSSATGKVAVSKIATVIIAPSIESIPNTPKDYTVSLKTSDGKPVAGESLKITLDGQTYTKATDNNGQVTIQTKLANENNYEVSVTYAGSSIYKNSNAVGTIKVSRLETQLTSYNRTFSKGSAESYIVSLKDSSNNAMANQVISYTLNNQTFSQNSDDNGQIKVNVSSLAVGSYEINLNYDQSNQYRASSSRSIIAIVNKTDVTFIDAGLPSDEIQARFDGAGKNVEFLGNDYNDVSLTINKVLNITFMPNTTLNGKAKSTVLTIATSNVNISNLIINANEGTGIHIIKADNVSIENNTISNTLDKSKTEKYSLGELIIPGNGIEISSASNVIISDNNVKSFGNAIFAQNSEDVKISKNTLSLSNYGITYGEDVKNTNITNNLITKNIGLYVMDIPEGPLGYGIFLNRSAVNVSIIHNNITDNYMGISVDSNYSTGIVITNNLICDNALEGIRFNAGYDLAENAVEPIVNDNAIYRNAKGPSMMILGELSANPNGIYQYGLYNVSKRLQLGANWFGKNARVTWDYDTNTTGYGTMCPRINATYISVKEIEVISPGNYSVTFYKYDEVASDLPVFEMYATLNDVEIKFYVVNGVGVFSFDAGNFTNESNVIKVSVGSLKDEYRTFEVLLNKTLDASEIPSQ